MRADGRRQPEVVEDRWPQALHDVPDLADDVLELRAGAGDEVGGSRSAGVLRSLEGERDARQRGPEPVVQIAPEATALLLVCGHDRPREI